MSMMHMKSCASGWKNKRILNLNTIQKNIFTLPKINTLPDLICNVAQLKAPLEVGLGASLNREATH
jgi:hypothetical protein